MRRKQGESKIIKMKIACLQFDSRISNVKGNIEKADSLLEKTAAGDLDLLVLPELAFTGNACPFSLIWHHLLHYVPFYVM